MTMAGRPCKGLSGYRNYSFAVFAFELVPVIWSTRSLLTARHAPAILLLHGNGRASISAQARPSALAGGPSSFSRSLRRRCSGGAGGGDRRHDDCPTAAVCARRVDIVEHRGGGDVAAGLPLCQRGAQDCHFPDAAPADHAVQV